MKILIAEDDRETSDILKFNLEKWGYSVTAVFDGEDAWNNLQKKEVPPLVIMDWVMPEMDGIQVCRKVRTELSHVPVYIILLTAKKNHKDIIKALQAGADDFISKPFNTEELRARVQVGERTASFQVDLMGRMNKLLKTRKPLSDMPPFLSICSYCKKIKLAEERWQPVESYISRRTEVQFSHSICPRCYDHHVQPDLDDLTKEEKH